MNRMKPSPGSIKVQVRAVEKWNEGHPIGTEVSVEMDTGELRATKTRSKAQMLGVEPSRNDPGHTAVIFLEGISGCYLLSRVRAKGEPHAAL